MMQRIALCALFSAGLILAACDSGSSPTDATPTSPVVTSEQLTLTLTFRGPSVSPSAVYACWIEDERGKDIQNVYVCNSAVGIGKTLTGDALPYWKTGKHAELAEIDGVTGASTQGNAGLTVTRTIPIGSPVKFRACFEIDRSLNDSANFGDRPSFIYKSDVIDATGLSPSPYELKLAGWMSNETGMAADGTEGSPYGQQPKAGVKIPGYAPYAYMTDLSWIAPVGDMVSLLTVSVTKP